MFDFITLYGLFFLFTMVAGLTAGKVSDTVKANSRKRLAAEKQIKRYPDATEIKKAVVDQAMADQIKRAIDAVKSKRGIVG